MQKQSNIDPTRQTTRTASYQHRSFSLHWKGHHLSTRLCSSQILRTALPGTGPLGSAGNPAIQWLSLWYQRLSHRTKKTKCVLCKLKLMESCFSCWPRIFNRTHITCKVWLIDWQTDGWMDWKLIEKDHWWSVLQFVFLRKCNTDLYTLIVITNNYCYLNRHDSQMPSLTCYTVKPHLGTISKLRLLDY